ncbi:MAG TPA: hypothetical protein VGL78_13450, partial [Solirubrobacteraceae bacterium]
GRRERVIDEGRTSFGNPVRERLLGFGGGLLGLTSVVRRGVKQEDVPDGVELGWRSGCDVTMRRRR